MRLTAGDCPYFLTTLTNWISATYLLKRLGSLGCTEYLAQYTYQHGTSTPSFAVEKEEARKKRGILALNNAWDFFVSFLRNMRVSRCLIRGIPLKCHSRLIIPDRSDNPLNIRTPFLCCGLPIISPVALLDIRNTSQLSHHEPPITVASWVVTDKTT